jgi:hypothetical protein
MRNLVQPLQSLRCKRCDGELRFERIESADSVFGAEVEVFVCARCGHAHLRSKSSDPYASHAATHMPRSNPDQPGESGGSRCA